MNKTSPKPKSLHSRGRKILWIFKIKYIYMAMLQTKIKIYVHKSGGPIVVTREKT